MNDRENDTAPTNGSKFEFLLPSGKKACGQKCPVCGCPEALVILTSICCPNSSCMWFAEEWDQGLGPVARDAIRRWKRESCE